MQLELCAIVARETRPVPGFSGHRTPVDGLYLCASGTHPGGGVMGLAGHNAAKEIIKRGELA